MALRIVPHAPELSAGVAEFNRRLRTAGIPYAFSTSPESKWLPRSRSDLIYKEHFIATEDNTVRGGYVLKHQPFVMRQEPVSVGNFQLPLSEGTCDRRYASVGVITMLDCMKRMPLLYSLGIGSHEEPLTKMLQAAHWTILEVPFLFRVVRPFRVLRGMAYARSSRARRFAMDAAAFTGLASVAVRAAHGLRARRGVRATAEAVPQFGVWADELWQEARSDYDLCAVRDAVSLNTLYPANDYRFLRMRVRQGSHCVGWAVCLCTPMWRNPYFGNLRVGTIVDVFSSARDARAVARAATRMLSDRGADLVITNQSHPAWCQAMRDSGLFQGPSNFLLALSPQLAKRVALTANAALHFTRGDGDGPGGL